MKSIMEEASSIIKAIEKGWIKAGHPKEFSVKIFEEPQKNFIGLTLRSAKIGIFFNDTVDNKIQEVTQPSKQKYSHHTKPASPTSTKENSKVNTSAKNKAKAVKEVTKPEDTHRESGQTTTLRQQENKENHTNNTVEQKEPKHTQPVWTEAMIQNVNQWLSETLELMQVQGTNFTIEPHHFHLKIQFDGLVLADKGRQKQLFASLATLLLQMLKHRYKRPLKGYKIILIGA